MTTNYDPIAEQYKESKQQPWRTYIESYTLMNMVGDISGKRVVDLACGEGFYTRPLRRKGAAKVVGIDLSNRMIELAREQEAQRPLGIEYVTGDVKALNLKGEYDLAVAAYLLNYARDHNELSEMCYAIASCLRPGGRFVTVNSSAALDYPTAPSYRKYGFETDVVGEFQEGVPITWTFFLKDDAFQIENYFLDTSVHEQAFRSAGFQEIRWHRPQLSPEGEAKHGLAFWKCFMDHPPIIGIECIR